MLRPGDRLEAEVYRIREIKSAPKHVQDRFRIVSLNINVPGRVRTYFATISWSLERMGREPRLGDEVMVEYMPPHPYDREPRGRFHILHLTGNAVDDAALGTVTWEPNDQAVYVRVQIEQVKGSPFAIKATFSGFDRKRLKKGTRVEVAQSDKDDARKYHVVRILEEDTITNFRFNITVRDADEFKRNQTMKTTEDRIRLFVGSKYLQHNKFYGVLGRAFGLDETVARELYRKQGDGFYVICRPDQFAYFMIYRNSAGIQNGFLDLKAEIIHPKGDVYSRISSAAGVDRCDVKKVLLALNYDRATVEERLEMRMAEVDVSHFGR